MIRVRLIPIVLFATVALLILKIVGGFSNSSLIAAGPGAALAAGGGRGPPPTAAPVAVERPKEQKEPPLPLNTSETAVNERLGDRRRQLDEQAKGLEQREALLKAAEKKIDERVEELKRLEQRVDNAVIARQEEKGTQYKNLVTMYENMKPKDAARILDKLDLEVTLELVTRMNARKTSEILAEMTAEAAQRLTIALARRGTSESNNQQSSASQGGGGAGGSRELPRIETKRPGG